MVDGVVDRLAAVRRRSSTSGWRRTWTFMRRLAAVTAAGIDPADIVQEALIRAWQERSSFDPARGSARTRLLALTADQARRLRTRWRDWELGDPRLLFGGMTPMNNLDDRGQGMRRLGFLDALIAALDQREAVCRLIAEASDEAEPV